MFEFELKDVEEKMGAKYGMELKFKALNMIRQAYIKASPLYKFEGDLWIFKDSNHAVLAALEM